MEKEFETAPRVGWNFRQVVCRRAVAALSLGEVILSGEATDNDRQDYVLLIHLKKVLIFCKLPNKTANILAKYS